MAESRRVQLTTLSCDYGPSSSGGPASDQKPPSGDLQEEKDGGSGGAADTGTVRLEVALFEADERSFPEFSYSQLVDNKMSRFKEEEKRDNDEVATISKKLEKKYGGKPKEDRIQDLIDIGFGYDEEDSFIDNSEAYDEFVPASITTKLGGFYVNMGMLHFRPASETEDLATEEETLEPSEKSSVNGGRGKPKRKKKKRCREGGAIITNVDPNSSMLSEIGPDDEMRKKKKRQAAGTLSVTSMLKKFQREKEKERQKKEKANQKSAAIMAAITIPLCPADAGGGGGSGLTDPLLSLIGSTNDHALIQAANAVDFDIDLDSLLDVTEQTSSPNMAPQPATETQLFRSKADDPTRPDAAPQVQPPNPETNLQLKPQSEQIQPSSQSSSTSTHQCVPLPEGLPPRLEDSVRRLMAVAKTSEGESKLKFFTPEINSVLLDIEVQCREQGVQLRSKVYTHLSSFLPCSRDTLLKRVKKLFLAHTEEPPDVDDPMQKLKEAIGRAMPQQMACFNQNCQVYEQVKALKATEEEKEGKVNVGPEDNVEEKGGRRGGGPKKSFKWNEEIRGSLCEVLKVRMERYKKEGTGSQETEHHLKTMLDNEVQPLWPKGWMQSRVLIRESRKMLSLFTSLPVKRARPEKKQPSVGGPRATSDGCSVLQGPPPLRGLAQEAADVIIVSSNSSNSTSLGTEKKEAADLKRVESATGEVAVDAGSSTLAKADKPPVDITSAPNRSLLDLLADQALAREQPFSVSQELIAAAVAKYKRSVQHWSFGVDTKSPPFLSPPPPPPPQSSPVGFPMSGVCHVVLPNLLQVARHMDASHVQIISDDEDITTQ
ncbi:ubinuclein-1-like [Anarrhichthys ocellatus]|uniref:ubinuclein-1-like n=1 Tax=Anarrhichthys ocellatus TaxID=433405 RepID=UPI0012ED6161|nr:ubinuclein-1-like [Anarrhichthys ocellatus]XP_031719165.1 ubinuclein-1-like [Anarrhichthys ocellatus]